MSDSHDLFQLFQRVQRAGRLRPALLVAPFLALVLLAGVWGMHSTPAAAQQPPPSPTFDLSQVAIPSDLPTAASGRGIYLESCAPCHGEQGLGDGPTAAELPSPPTAFADPDAVWDKTPAELFHTTKFGRLEALMPPWQNELDDRQIWNVVAYAWGLHTDIQTVEMGADLYGLSCANCHGETGAGDGPDAEGDLPDFSDLGYAMTRSQADWLAGWTAAHPEVGGDWAMGDQQQVLEYIRTFSYSPPWESAYRPGNGQIRGEVVQGTAGAALTTDATVTLEAYAEFTPVASFTSTLGVSGTFEFSGLAVDPAIVYLASVSASGIRYSSSIITLSDEQPVVDTRITVYATTGDPSGLQLDRAHWIVDSQPGALLVGEILSFGSTDDHTYLGTAVEGVDVPVTIALHLPEGAEEIIFENGSLGDRFRRAGDLVYDTTPVVPGEATKQIIVRYVLPYEGTSLELAHDFLYPVAQMSLLVADLPGLQVEASGLTSLGPQDFQGQTYQIWQDSDVPPGTITLSMSGLLAAGDVDPRAFAETGSSTTGAPQVSGLEPWVMWLSALLVVAVLGGGMAWSWRQGRLRSGDRGGNLDRQYNDLAGRIAQLDDFHALGKIDTETWLAQRARLKAQLLEVTRRKTEQPAKPARS